MDQESKRIKEQRRTESKDEAINPTSEAQKTGRSEESKEKADENKAVRNPSSYENEFGSKKAGPGGYGDRAKKPVTDQKRDRDAMEREKNFEKEDKKKDKEFQDESFDEEANKAPSAKETKKHGNG